MSDIAKGADEVFISPTWAVTARDLVSSFVGEWGCKESDMTEQLLSLSLSLLEGLYHVLLLYFLPSIIKAFVEGRMTLSPCSFIGLRRVKRI